jgi:hypothetical protein
MPQAEARRSLKNRPIFEHTGSLKPCSRYGGLRPRFFAKLDARAKHPSAVPRPKSLSWFFALLLLSPAPRLSASLVTVKHKEGITHGFLILQNQQGRALATGDMLQTEDARKVTLEIALHFKDGSIYDEVAVFSQDGEFRLLSDHLQLKGRSFPKPIDAYINVPDGTFKLHAVHGGKAQDDERRLEIPEDAANGITLVLLKNIKSADAENSLSWVNLSSKPAIVKLKVHSEAEQGFRIGSSPRKATHYVVHVDIGGLPGAVAPLIGKQPPDTHVWLSAGKAPTFVRFEGPLYEGGPIWAISLANVTWGEGAPPKKSR